jgi:predicted dehydrogenase
MPPVRIAVVGTGLIGRAHVERITAEPEAALAAIVDPTPGARALADQHGVPWFERLEPMLETEAADGVVIATPNQLHVEHAIA